MDLSKFVLLESTRATRAVRSEPIRVTTTINSEDRSFLSFSISAQQVKKMRWQAGDKISIMYDVENRALALVRSGTNKGYSLYINSGGAKSRHYLRITKPKEIDCGDIDLLVKDENLIELEVNGFGFSIDGDWFDNKIDEDETCNKKLL